jgi:outer membrane biosynthesis protein TonB
MRRTCARVLAAALMAGAVAAAMALPGRFIGGGSEAHQALTAPAASSKRVIHVDVRVTSAKHRAKAQASRPELAGRSSSLASTVVRRNAAPAAGRPARAHGVSARHGSIRPNAPHKPRPTPSPSPTPAPAPAPEPTAPAPEPAPAVAAPAAAGAPTRELASAAPAPAAAPVPPPAPPTDDQSSDSGQPDCDGGHDSSHGSHDHDLGDHDHGWNDDRHDRHDDHSGRGRDR